MTKEIQLSRNRDWLAFKTPLDKIRKVMLSLHSICPNRTHFLDPRSNFHLKPSINANNHGIKVCSLPSRLSLSPPGLGIESNIGAR
jgi:hypothetical protein